jgi:hypothetical protein
LQAVWFSDRITQQSRDEGETKNAEFRRGPGDTFFIEELDNGRIKIGFDHRRLYRNIDHRHTLPTDKTPNDWNGEFRPGEGDEFLLQRVTYPQGCNNFFGHKTLELELQALYVYETGDSNSAGDLQWEVTAGDEMSDPVTILSTHHDVTTGGNKWVPACTRVNLKDKSEKFTMEIDQDSKIWVECWMRDLDGFFNGGHDDFGRKRFLLNKSTNFGLSDIDAVNGEFTVTLQEHGYVTFFFNVVVK